MAETFQSIVVQINMGHWNIIHMQPVRINGKTVILGCDFNFARNHVFNRLIDTSVSEFEFKGSASKGYAENLMPQTNPEHGFVVN